MNHRRIRPRVKWALALSTFALAFFAWGYIPAPDPQLVPPDQVPGQVARDENGRRIPDRFLDEVERDRTLTIPPAKAPSNAAPGQIPGTSNPQANSYGSFGKPLRDQSK